jgi:hypothetical protein
MDKNKLLTFIEKYNLGGSVESVKLVSDGKTLKTGFVTEDKTLAGSVTLNTCDIAKADLAVFKTAELKNFLKSMDGELTITLKTVDNRVTGFVLTDDNSEFEVVLADMSVIPKAPAVKAPKDFDVEIPISPEFADLFVKKKNTLPDVDSFTLMMKGGKLVLVIGYSNINSNRVTLNLAPVAGKDKLDNMISFNANYFKEILLKNSDSTGAVLKVAAAGIASISFTTPDFEANYFLIKKEIES